MGVPTPQCLKTQPSILYKRGTAGDGPYCVLAYGPSKRPAYSSGRPPSKNRPPAHTQHSQEPGRTPRVGQPSFEGPIG